MELESIMLSEISQAVRDKYHMVSPLTALLFANIHVVMQKSCFDS